MSNKSGGHLGRPVRAGRADWAPEVVRVRLDAGSLSFLVGPAIALLALLVIGLFLRWAFGASPTTRARGRGPAAELLTPVATVSRPETAQALRAVLTEAGIRSTTRSPAPHRTDVLVFPADADRARQLALTFGGG